MDWIEEVEEVNETIANMMKQYEKVVWILKEDCEKKWIAFIWYCYFRQSDSIKNQDASYYWTNTTIEPYDKYYASRSFNDYIDN